MPTSAPDRLTLRPLDGGRYGLDATFYGEWGCEDAEERAAELRARRHLPHTLVREPDGGWTVRLGPLRSIDVAAALAELVG